MAKPAIIQWVEENWESVECQFYSGIQAGAFNAAVGSAFTGKIPLALGLAGVSYAAGWTAEQAGCGYTPPEPELGPELEGCKKLSSGRARLWLGWDKYKPFGYQLTEYYTELISVDEFVAQAGPSYRIRWREGTYEEQFEILKKETFQPLLRADPYPDAICEEPFPEPQPPVHNPGDPIADPIVTSTGGCTWTIQATDSYVDDQMVMHTYYVISADNDACGGPFAYWSSDKGPDWVAPNPPNPDAPDTPQPPLPPKDYNPRFDDIDDDLDKVQEELEKLKECACPEKPELAKHWRSIRFESDENTPRGNRRLSKLLRYRGVSPGVVESVAAHWKDFRWTTGPVCVYHKGSPLGTPQVWAATADEGKRVIRHAAGEAGINPDQVGEWGVSSSDNARYGVSLEVGLYCVDGCWSSTARPGPDGYPQAAVVQPDP